MGSLAVLAGSGILINLVIAAFRDASALGVFNLAYAVYIVASQIAVFGLHYSVIRHSALYDKDADERGRLLVNAGFYALLLGFGATSVVFLAAPLLGHAFSSPLTGSAVRYASLGLLLFPLTKVLMGYLNGLRHMKAIAVLQSTRYVIVMLWATAISVSTLPFELVTAGFFISELTTTCGVFIYLKSRRMLPLLHFDPAWTKRHFVFGGKSLFAGLFVELNSRIDVLLIGLFLSDREVGIYSFAAMLFDGLYQILAFVRINFNPVLVGSIRDHDWVGARNLLKQTKKYMIPGIAGLSLSIVAVFWVLTNYFVAGKGLELGFLPLCILLTGILLLSTFIPFDNLMLVSGHPGLQTFQQMTIVSSNIVFNSVLIPLLGITGAAIAVTFSNISGILTMLHLVRRTLGWNLLTNRVQKPQ